MLDTFLIKNYFNARKALNLLNTKKNYTPVTYSYDETRLSYSAWDAGILKPTKEMIEIRRSAELHVKNWYKENNLSYVPFEKKKIDKNKTVTGIMEFNGKTELTLEEVVELEYAQDQQKKEFAKRDLQEITLLKEKAKKQWWPF